MIHKTLYIRGRWRVDWYMDNGDTSDFGVIADCLYDMGAPKEVFDRAERKFKKNLPNEAFTYSNGMRSIIYIGRTTNGEEFLNSLIHEMRHLIDHIAKYYGLDNGEAVGYLSGDTALALAEEICLLGCRKCNK